MHMIGIIQQNLRTPLTEAEKAEESKVLLAHLEEYDELESKAKQSAKEFKDAMDEAWTRVQRSKDLIAKGPYKTVDVEEHLDGEQVVQIRSDLGTVVGRRSAEPVDYQFNLVPIDRVANG